MLCYVDAGRFQKTQQAAWPKLRVMASPVSTMQGGGGTAVVKLNPLLIADGKIYI